MENFQITKLCNAHWLLGSDNVDVTKSKEFKTSV